MKILIYSDIVNEQERIWMEWEGNNSAISFESIQKALASRSEDDKKIELFFNCRGGECIEGWAIYDLLRQQTGCEIFSTIEGECSSMATIILLAAPKENRKAYQNASLCIHNPCVGWFDTDYFERLTADNIRKTATQILNQADCLQMEQNRILDCYVERTGTDRETLQTLMDQDVYVDMAKAQELGFISGIIAPTTAQKKSQFKAYNINQKPTTNKMEKPNAKATMFNELVVAMKKIFGIDDSAPVVAMQITGVDGSQLTIERESGDPQVGDKASPDGEFTLEDGSKIVVEGGVITEITAPEPAADPEPEPEPEPQSSGATDTTEEQPKATDTTAEDPEKEALQKTIDEQAATIEELKKQIEDLQQSIKSAEDVAILKIVDDAGGKEAVLNAIKASSQFNAQNPKDVDHKGSADSRQIGDTYLESRTTEYNAMMAKLRR